MGQRSQLFVYCLNPVKGLKDQLKSLKKYNGGKAEYDKLKLRISEFENAFGTKEHTIIAYHHQWLFGRSSLQAAANLIDWNINTEKDSNPFKCHNEISGNEYLNLLTNILSLFNNNQAKLIGRYGFEHFRLLNFIEPSMRLDCRAGDNNDGVIIFNCIDDSYCFLNIGTGDSTVSQLTEMIPCSADQYVRLYYPIEANDSKTANVPKSNKEQETYFNNNRRMNRLFTKPFENYRLITQAELKKMFPTAFNTVTTSNDII